MFIIWIYDEQLEFNSSCIWMLFMIIPFGAWESRNAAQESFLLISSLYIDCVWVCFSLACAEMMSIKTTEDEVWVDVKGLAWVSYETGGYKQQLYSGTRT